MTPTALELPLPAPRSRLRVLLEFARYFAASALALGVDVGLYRAGLGAGLPYAVAAMIGFVGGAVVAYLASVRWVFTTRRVRSATLEFGAFVAVGIAGLLLTELGLWLAIERAGLAPMPARLCVAGAVFVFNFVVRKVMLFA